MNNWDRRYTDRVQLLVEILPLLAQEPSFALKGGTAINLFEHDLPRLSVDIDLTWLPVHDYDHDVQQIETTPVMRGAVHQVRQMQVRSQVE